MYDSRRICLATQTQDLHEHYVMTVCFIMSKSVSTVHQCLSKLADMFYRTEKFEEFKQSYMQWIVGFICEVLICMNFVRNHELANFKYK